MDKKWIMKNPKYKDQKVLPGCERKFGDFFFLKKMLNKISIAICSPPCANKGKCVAPNRCQCTKDFQGALCKEKACLAQPLATRNSKRSCKPG